MSPEQVNGDRGTPASDLWSLGVTLYHAVEGRHAFKGPNLAAILLSVDRGDPAPMVHAGPLEPILRGLMSKDPARRPTASEAAAELSTPGRSLPPTVPKLPLPSAPRPPSPTRRRLLLAMGAVGTAAALPAVGYLLGRETPSRKANASPTTLKANTPPPSWNAPRQDGELSTRSGGISSVAFSPDGRTLAVAISPFTEEDKLQLWDVATRNMQDEFPKTAGAPVDTRDHILRAVFRPDGRFLATADLNGTARLWHVASRTQEGRPLDHEGTVRDVSFDKHGLFLATVGLDELVRLWDVTTRTRLKRRFKGADDDEFLTSVAFSPDGGTLAAGSSSEVVWLWDVATGKRLGEPIAHSGIVETVAFSPAGGLLATGVEDGDGIVHLWRP